MEFVKKELSQLLDFLKGIKWWIKEISKGARKKYNGKIM